MGAVLLSCGNHGRYILPHGEVMIHEPLLGDRVGVTVSQLNLFQNHCWKLNIK